MSPMPVVQVHSADKEENERETFAKQVVMPNASLLIKVSTISLKESVFYVFNITAMLKTCMLILEIFL